MKSLGVANTKDELLALIAKHDLEFVEAATFPGVRRATFVSYNPKTASGKFHHYVTLEMPDAIYKDWMKL